MLSTSARGTRGSDDHLIDVGARPADLVDRQFRASAPNELWIADTYKSELITMRGRWRTVEEVEVATLGWVHWWNTTRLHTGTGNIPPADLEAAHYAQQQPAVLAGRH